MSQSLVERCIKLVVSKTGLVHVLDAVVSIRYQKLASTACVPMDGRYDYFRVNIVLKGSRAP